MLTGVDYHPSFQQIAFLAEETGEYSERRLNHSDGEAEKFYRDLQQRGVQVRVGMQAIGCSRWFERLLAELGFEVCIGEPAEIMARRVKKQKTDRKDAQLLLKLMLEDRFRESGYPARRGTEQCGLATSICALGEASAQEHCQGRDGAQAGSLRNAND